MQPVLRGNPRQNGASQANNHRRNRPGRSDRTNPAHQRAPSRRQTGTHRPHENRQQLHLPAQHSREDLGRSSSSSQRASPQHRRTQNSRSPRKNRTPQNGMEKTGASADHRTIRLHIRAERDAANRHNGRRNKAIATGTSSNRNTKMTAEIWKPIVGYEELYEVSNQGRIRSRSTIKAQTTGHSGYKFVTLSRNGAVKKHRTHIIVATAFHGPKPHGREIAGT